MEVVEVTQNNGVYVRIDDGAAWNPEREIAIVQVDSPTYDLAYRLGSHRLYNITINYKILYPESKYNDAWKYINDIKGTITSVDDNFDVVMPDEGLTEIMGNVRIARINYSIKKMSNGKDCDDCKC